MITSAVLLIILSVVTSQHYSFIASKSCCSKGNPSGILASFPGPSRGGERAWYTLYAHVPGDPRKMWGNRILSYTLRLSSIELYVMQNPRMITMVTRPVTMETPVHARAVCTRPFLLLLKGLGTRLVEY